MLEATNSGLHDVTISTSWMEEWIRTDTIRPHLTHYMSLSLSRNPSSCLRERCKTHNDPPRLTGVDRSGLFNKQLFEGLTENRSAIVMFKRSKFEIFWIWLWQICSCGVTNRTKMYNKSLGVQLHTQCWWLCDARSFGWLSVSIFTADVTF